MMDLECHTKESELEGSTASVFKKVAYSTPCFRKSHLSGVGKME